MTEPAKGALKWIGIVVTAVAMIVGASVAYGGLGEAVATNKHGINGKVDNNRFEDFRADIKSDVKEIKDDIRAIKVMISRP